MRHRLDWARRDPEGYWAFVAGQLPWAKPWERVFERDGASFRWFVGGRTNIAVNAVDRHADERPDQLALRYRNERGDARDLTYRELHELVRRYSAALRGLGVNRGDRITIYLPPCVESIALMLAATRIGAIHSVVFAGFGSGALADRIAASGSRWLFTADFTWRKGKPIDLAALVADALDHLPEPLEAVVTLRRDPSRPLRTRALDWDAWLARGEGQSDAPEVMEANEPAFILATSGTTARPKLVVHNHGGYQVGVHHGGQVCYGLEPSDTWWTTSDIGWIVGHSYMVYGPLLAGATTVVYEGALDHPHPDQIWRLAAELGVTGLFTSPTAVRLLMRLGADGSGHDLSRLRRVVCAGEVLNPAAYRWLAEDVFAGRVPVLDNMWQTETGAPIFGNPWRGGLEVRPGSAGIALPGVDPAVVDQDGRPLPPGEPGIAVLRAPVPSLTATLWGEPERYANDYWGRVPGAYYVGDAARIDADGYVWFTGRADEVIKIAAHRIGTIEVESALLTHPAVGEAGVTGRPDELRGEVISAFVTLKPGYEPSPRLEEELRATVRRELGPVAVIGEIRFVSSLPKTRSGKVMRRVLKAVVLGTPPGDVTTLEDEASVEEATRAWRELSG
ncbi:acetyl-CoA synthetase [Carbonactinospora thermoautotrophica]|uniref:Acetyl-CoA synthetase n=2 Tax=Carbonactinospora thermoautotrophica TaxID=1469144 RepID=A0A132MKS6_9ACTN|nr:acetyl-CoA synthetase [Carbonactinospora thermoautotrophica]